MNAHGTLEGPPRSAASEDRWKALTQQASVAYANQESEAADDLYRSALAEADLLLCNAENGAGIAQAPALLVISHHSLAQLALKHGQAERATEHYRSAFYRLLALAGNTSAPLGLREECVPPLKVALIALASHLGTCGALSGKLLREMARARDALSAARGRPR